MTNAQDILANLEADPDSEILAAMLTDALMEERGQLRSEADRHVEIARQNARDARDMKFACGLFRARGPAAFMIREFLLVQYLGGESIPFTVYLILGSNGPTTTFTLEGNHPAFGNGDHAIAVPAKWVCEWHRKYQYPIRYPRPSRKAK